MTQSLDERWRTVEVVGQQGEQFLVQQKMTVTQSPAEENRLDDSTGFTVLPEADHRVIRLETVVQQDAREKDISD